MTQILHRRLQRTALAFSCGVVLMTAGCFRSASDAPTDDSAATPTTAPPTITVGAPLIADPTNDPQFTIVTPPTPTETIDQPPSPLPTLTPAAGSGVNTVPTLTPTSNAQENPPTIQPPGAFNGTPTITFITPGSPLGFITPDPMTPTAVTFGTTSTPDPFGALDSDPLATDDAIAEECIYIVQPGDTLFGIALQEDISVAAIREANPDLVGTDPILQIEQELRMPYEGCPDYIAPTITPTRNITPSTSAEGSGELYIVQPGDTLSNIAARFGVTIQAIVEANNLANPDVLDVGDELVIPSGD